MPNFEKIVNSNIFVFDDSWSHVHEYDESEYFKHITYIRTFFNMVLSKNCTLFVGLILLKKFNRHTAKQSRRYEFLLGVWIL